MENDPAYLYRLQQMRISDESPKVPTHHHQQPTESFINAPRQSNVQYVSVAPSRFAYQNQMQGGGNHYAHESPTLSNYQGGMQGNAPPPAYGVYENVEYYKGDAPNSGEYGSNRVKAQPQVAIGYASNAPRYAHTPQPVEMEPSPIYENLHTATGQLAQPQASPATSSIYYNRSGSQSPQIVGNAKQQPGVIMSDATSVINPLASQRYINIESPKHSYSVPKPLSPDYVSCNVSPAPPMPQPQIAKPPPLAQKIMPPASHLKSNSTNSIVGNSPSNISISRQLPPKMKPQTENVNGSDYVIMSGAQKATMVASAADNGLFNKSKVVQQKATVPNEGKPPVKAPVQLPGADALIPTALRVSPRPGVVNRASPTPSVLSGGSGKRTFSFFV